MLDKEYYKDLVSPDYKLISIHHVNWWLMKYEFEFYDAIPKSECGKWGKWVKDNSINVLPCACHTREQDCIFIEMYFELLRVSELEESEVLYEKILEEYRTVEYNEFAISLWLEKYKSIWQSSRFDEVIRIKTFTKPYTKIEILLNHNDFKNLIKFRKLYSKNYYFTQQ